MYRMMKKKQPAIGSDKSKQKEEKKLNEEGRIRVFPKEFSREKEP